MAKEFIYNKTKEIGKLEENTTVEIGHYKVDGKDMPDKVYLVSHFIRKNGTEDDLFFLLFNLFLAFFDFFAECYVIHVGYFPPSVE